MKILAIDYGTKNIGLALSDDEKKIAFAYRTLKQDCHSDASQNPSVCRQQRDPDFRQDDKKEKNKKVISNIKNICEQEHVKKIIIGLPLWLTGNKSKTTERVLKFARELEKGTGLPVETIDERLSTVQANKLENKNADNIDELSAQILLAGWLEKI